ncbi:MAG: hypothetical protein LBS72_08700 [Oscillospiraceae bacterium]|nr:hypothetical protein [Oscillospiraceae bacterium]
MNELSNLFFAMLMSWVRSLSNRVWSAIRGGGGGQWSWIAAHWIECIVVLAIIGLALDWFIWMLRWRPYRLWISNMRRNRKGGLIAAETFAAPPVYAQEEDTPLLIYNQLDGDGLSAYGSQGLYNDDIESAQADIAIEDFAQSESAETVADAEDAPISEEFDYPDSPAEPAFDSHADNIEPPEGMGSDPIPSEPVGYAAALQYEADAALDDARIEDLSDIPADGYGGIYTDNQKLQPAPEYTVDDSYMPAEQPNAAESIEDSWPEAYDENSSCNNNISDDIQSSADSDEYVGGYSEDGQYDSNVQNDQYDNYSYDSEAAEDYGAVDFDTEESEHDEKRRGFWSALVNRRAAPSNMIRTVTGKPARRRGLFRLTDDDHEAISGLPPMMSLEEGYNKPSLPTRPPRSI